MPLPKTTPIAILGAGAFGLSTALELANQGFTQISVYERDSQIPSRWSAANDLNKIMRVEYEDEFYTELAVEAASHWLQPLFAPYFHRTGYLNCASGSAPQKAINAMLRFKHAAERHPTVKSYVDTISSADDVRKICPQFSDGEIPGWKGYFCRYDGWVHSADALRAVYQEVVAKGVKVFLGEQAGSVREIVYEGEEGENRKSVGIRTSDGHFHAASLVIVAVGAAANKIVPEVGRRVAAKSWAVAHVRLTREETARLKGIPVTYERERGFFFEPDVKTNLLKLCPMGGGYVNTNAETGVSEVPEGVSRGWVPLEDERKMRELLRQTLPYLADRPLVEKSLCWFADTADSDFIIDYVPDTSNSVILLSGDSGHGFKMFPIFGRWVLNLLNESTGIQSVERWRWKAPALGETGDSASVDVSWRVGGVKELRDIKKLALVSSRI